MEFRKEDFRTLLKYVDTLSFYIKIQLYYECHNQINLKGKGSSRTKSNKHIVSIVLVVQSHTKLHKRNFGEYNLQSLSDTYSLSELLKSMQSRTVECFTTWRDIQRTNVVYIFLHFYKKKRKKLN